MAYIVKRKNREGREYVYLVESFREKGVVKNRTLKSYGRYDLLEKNDPGAFERLRREAEQGLLGGEIPKQLVVTYDTNKAIGIFEKAYGWKLFEPLFDHLNIGKALKETLSQAKKTEHLIQTLKLLIYQRILNPGSKLYTLNTQESLFGEWSLKDNTVYRALEVFSKAKEAIQLEAHKRITESTNRTGSLVFYDVTNYYFDIDFDDSDRLNTATQETEQGLRKKGPCKAQSGNPIVQLGLFMDTNGIPISYQLFRGNFTDVKTYLPAIEHVKKQFGLNRIIVVADKAMNSKDNVSKTQANQDGWLFSQKHRGKRGAPKDVQAFILEQSGWLYNQSETFACKSTIRTRILNNKQSVQEKVLVTWNKKYAEREKKRRDGALDYASKLTNAELFRQTAKKGGKKYLELSYLDKDSGEIKPFSPLIKLDQEQVEFDEQFDGVNVLVTSELDMTNEQMIASYGQLHIIEDCFRVTKTELHTRPVYVRLEEHIEAHFLTCFLALVMIRLLQHKTDWMFSAERLIKAINSAKATPLTTGFYQVQASDDFVSLLKVLGIDWGKAIVKYEDLNNFGNGWYTTK